MGERDTWPGDEPGQGVPSGSRFRLPEGYELPAEPGSRPTSVLWVVAERWDGSGHSAPCGVYSDFEEAKRQAQESIGASALGFPAVYPVVLDAPLRHPLTPDEEASFNEWDEAETLAEFAFRRDEHSR